jgi:transcriptional regulator with PAS, ATPase and Fis domain
MCFDVPTTASVQRARLEAVFDSTRTLDGWTCQLLDTATHVAALILEIERCQGRRAGSRARPDGAAPLIGSSQAIRAVRERIERVAATDFTVLIEGASGPQPHPILLSFQVRLPSVGATGRWRERGRMGSRC